MSSIDSRVVEARFDNKQFQAGVKETVSSLDNLKKGLNMDGATKGLSTLSSAASTVANRFNIMRVAAYTAVATIAHQLTIAGEQLVRSFTVGPLIDGLHEYETQLNSVQTILANTQWEHKNLDDVNKALNELNHYSDKTIYNFTEMARNIGTFTAAGVGLDKSVASIKGIANLAAVSGSNSQQASTAMYQLSQAISSGTVKLMDWNSVVNAGMGGKVFQDSLMQTAKVHGVAIDDMIKKEGSFRNTLQNGWLTSKILTETLAKFTGDLSRSQLKSMGYTEKQIDGIIKMGKTATDAATKVKTFTQLMGTLREAAGSGWAKTWQLIIGNFNQAKEVWTNVSNTLGGMLQSSAKARNAMLKEWAALGGRKALIEGISDAFHALMSILTPIHDAFREIFPKTTAQELVNITKSFRDLMENFKIGADTADKLKRTFAGVFAIFDIGWQVIKAVASFIGDLFSELAKGSGGLLSATAGLGDFFVALDQAIKKGQGLTKFFQGLAAVIKPVIAVLENVVSAIFGIFDFKSPSSEQIAHSFTPLEALGHMLVSLWNNVLSILGNVFTFAAKIGSSVAKAFSGIGAAVSDAVGGINYEDVLHTINTGLFAGLVLLIKKFVGQSKNKTSILGGLVDAIKEPFEELTGTLQQMQKTLRATTLLQIAAAIGIMAASVVALSQVDAQGLKRALAAMTAMFIQLFGALMAFERIGGAKGLFTTSSGLIVLATALRVLTSSVKALAQLSWEELAKGLIGMTGLIGGLILATKGIGGNAGGMIRAGAGLLVLSAAIKVLASAMTDISALSWGQIAKGLTGVAATLVALALFTKIADANKAGVLQGAGLLLLGAAIKVLASAVSDFAATGWQGLAKGLVAISGVLLAVSIFSKTVGNPVKLMAAGAALVAIGVAMNILAKAIESFAKLSWDQIVKGLVTLAGALVIITGALEGMEGGLLGAAALVVVAGAIRVLTPALQAFGDMDWGSIAKAMVVLAGSMVIFIAAMAGAEEGLPGAAAVLVMAGAMRILAPILLAFGNMSWTEIAKGLITLAGAFAVLGVAGLVLTPVIPSLLGLAGAVALLGVGMLAVGGGVMLFAAGLTALAAGATAVIGVVGGLLGLLPVLAKQIGLSVVVIAETIGQGAPRILEAAIKIIDMLLTAINKEGPKIIKTLGKLIVELVQEVSKAVPKMTDAAMDLILGVLHAIDKKAPEVVHSITKMIVDILHAMANDLPKIIDAGTDLIVAYLRGIAKNLPRIIHAGTDVIIAFIKGVGKNAVRIANAAMDTIVDFANGLAKAINSHTEEFRTAGKNIAFAIANGMTLGLAGKVANVAKGAVGLAKSGLSAAGHFLGISSPSKEYWKLGKWSGAGLVGGMDAMGKAANEAGKRLADNSLDGASKEFRQAANYILKDFPKDLIGGKDEVKQTIQDTQNLLHNAVQQSHQDIQQLTKDLKDLKNGRDDDNKSVRDASNAVVDAQAKLDKLTESENSNAKAIREAKNELTDAKSKLEDAKQARHEHEKAIRDDTAALAQATDEHTRAKNALDAFDAEMDKHKSKLIDLGKQYDEYKTKIDAAKQALNDALQTQKNYNDQIVQQYSDLPDISADTNLDDYTQSLTDQVGNTQKFIEDLNTLRDQFKLSDDLYKELLAKGPAILPFVEQLLAGGQAAVDQLDTLTEELDDEAKVLGKKASESLYQAGVDAAQGLLDGLQKKEDKVEKQMQHIADIIAKEIRKQLKIKSPSQVMDEIGQNVGQGLIDGMASMESGIDRQGKKLVDQMNSYIKQLNALLAQAEAITPKITPVLDLSSVKKDAAKINGIVAQPISVASSFSSASQAAFGVNNNRDAIAESTTKVAPTANRNVTFVQNNTSPKALSSAEIYRQTKNQLSKAKGALTKDAA